MTAHTAPTFLFPFRVYIEDTDAGGIVYHANHLKYMERARTEWLRAHDIDHYLKSGQTETAQALPDHHDKSNFQDKSTENHFQKLPNSSFSFVVHQLQITYHLPARMDDLLLVSVTAVSCGAASLVLKQSIYRHIGNLSEGLPLSVPTDKASLIAEASVTLACLNEALRPRRLPDAIRQLVEQYLNATPRL